MSLFAEQAMDTDMDIDPLCHTKVSKSLPVLIRDR